MFSAATSQKRASHNHKSVFSSVVKQLQGLRRFQVPTAQINRISVEAPQGWHEKKQTNKTRKRPQQKPFSNLRTNRFKSSLSFQSFRDFKIIHAHVSIFKTSPWLKQWFNRATGSRTFQICPPYLDDSNCQERTRCPGALWRCFPSEHAANLGSLLPQTRPGAVLG